MSSRTVLVRGMWARQSLPDARGAAAGFSGVARLPENMQMTTRSLRPAAWLGCGRQGLGFGVVSGSGPAAFLALRLQQHPVSPARLSCWLRRGRSGGHTGAPKNPDFQGLLMRAVGLRSGVRAGGPGVEREAGRTQSCASVQRHCLLESQTLLPLQRIGAAR